MFEIISKFVYFIFDTKTRALEKGQRIIRKLLSTVKLRQTGKGQRFKQQVGIQQYCATNGNHGRKALLSHCGIIMVIRAFRLYRGFQSSRL